LKTQTKKKAAPKSKPVGAAADESQKLKARELLKQWASDHCLVELRTGPIMVVGWLGELGAETGDRFLFFTDSQEIQATISFTRWDASLDSVDPPSVRFCSESEQGFTLSRKRDRASLSDEISHAKERLAMWAKSRIPLAVQHQSSFVSVISRCRAVHENESAFRLIGLDSHQAYLINLLDCESINLQHSAAGATLLLVGFTGDSRLMIAESNASIAEEIRNLCASE
jgi:hypothetical protein